MWIDVQIPYGENGRLAAAYNRALRQGGSEWVLFLDHDVFLCNPRWYEMCVMAIETLEKSDSLVACIGCECGGERHRKALNTIGIEIPDSIEHHIDVSKYQYKKWGNTLEMINQHVPGFFMLLKRQVAIDIGFRQNGQGINNIDKDFGSRLREAGHHIYHMRGLYIYHRRGMKHLRKEFTLQND